MGKYFRNRHFLTLAILVAGVLMQSCKEDVFNPEKVKAAYLDRFPVKDIDPLMDWKMTRQVKVSISIHEDEGTDYRIRIYDTNPLADNSSARLLAEGTAGNTAPFSTVMDCPTTVTSVFVCRTDLHNRSVAKYVSIENDRVNAAFGTPSATVRAAWTRSVDIENYSPEKSEKEMAARLPDAEELTNSDKKFESGHYYKISEGNIYQNKFTSKNIDPAGPAIILIEGQWKPNGNNMTVEPGFELYVLDGGEIIIPDNHVMTMEESSRFIVYEGGTVKGNAIVLDNAAAGNYNYNAGTVEVNSIQGTGDGTLYSCGTVRTDDMTFGEGCKFVNQGKAYIGETHHPTVIDNGCYLEVQELTGTLNMGDNSAAKIKEFGDEDNRYDTRITMGDNSMITALDEETGFSRVSFSGPGQAYALVKIKELEEVSRFSSQGNIYYEFKKIDEDIHEKEFMEAIENSGGIVSKWGESPVTIPSGDCTGDGNTPEDSGSELPAGGIPYTYVFEDNFPLVGDYDFNDVVLDVETQYQREKKTNFIKKIQLNVTLTATGASKPLSVGLRITDISKTDIRAITTGGSDSRFQASFNDPNCLFDYNSGSHMEDSDPDVVIPIAGEVHNVFGEKPGKLINTGDGTALKAYTYEIIIEPSDPGRTDPLFSKDNLDFFICYSYKSMQRRMEVHLYEFWGYGATAAGTVQQENLDLAGNNTWAICVPYGFRYPKERINISRTDIPEESAYPQFIYWAKDRTQNTEWYAHPVEGNVYR